MELLTSPNNSLESIILPDSSLVNLRGPLEIVDEFFIKSPPLFELYKRSLPPKEAYYYFPKGEEVFIPHKKKAEKSLRRIYLNVPYNEKEEKWLSDYKKIIKSHPENELPSFWNDAWNLIFIYATECKLENSYKRMMTYIDWMNKRFPITITPEDNALKLLNSGFVYVHGRDSRFHPIIICQPYILERELKEYTIDEIERGSFFLCQYVLNRMLIPGQIEGWIMIVNLEFLHILNMPDPFKKIIVALSNNFPSRLHKCYIFGMSILMRILFQFVSNFLDEITVKKTVIISGPKDENLFKDFNRQNLEKKFGGDALDVEYHKPNGLFPPRMPCSYFFKESDDPKELLITENEYMEKVKKGEIPKQSLSPFIIEKINKMKKEKIIRNKEKENIRKMFKNKFQYKKKSLMINPVLKAEWKIKKEMFDLSKFRPFETSSNCFNEIQSFSQRKKSFCNTLTKLGNKNKSEYLNTNKSKSINKVKIRIP